MKIKSTKIRTEIYDYKHKESKRINNPEEGLATYLPEEHVSKKYSYDPHLDPQLVWSGKAERESFETPVVPLHIHERATPKSILNALEKRGEHQLRLFDEAEYPLEQRVDFYKHQMDWANRLILGDSLLVMNSLLTKELMGGKFQMIYIDPPYGIAYNSNFQPQLNQTVVKDLDDNSLTREPEQVRAFRDTWELGIHSYLTYLRDRLLLARELLAESGSIFVQMSDKNVHLVRFLMDEIFDKDNFVSEVIFSKTSGFSSQYLATTNDYLLWYAKNKSEMKYHQLFLPKESGRGIELYRFIELLDGTRRKLTKEELEDPRKVPEGRLFRISDICSQGETGSTQEFVFEGRQYLPRRGSHWSTTIEGLNNLAAKNRIMISAGIPQFVRYLDDYPVTKLTNIWADTATGSFTDPKIYVVQTATKVVARCILMTTDPGDLVFDPTCGSGTTAYVAEQWGRRWITCDTSRVSIALARQRLMTAVFPYYQLEKPSEGLRSGFAYKKVPHISLGSIAYDEPPKMETLYDSVNIDTSAIRVSGPFTVEAIPPPSASDVESLAKSVMAGNGTEEYLTSLVETLRKSGIIFPGGKTLKFQSLVPVSSAAFIHAEGTFANGTNRHVAISFGPRYGPLGVRQTEEAIRAATVTGYPTLVLAGFQIDPAAQAFIQRASLRIEVHFAHINPDMEIHDLLKHKQGSQIFSVFGEPDVEVQRDNAGKFYVRLKGVDTYDPITGKTEQTAGKEMPAWFLDEDFDGYSFNVCQAFFPSGATKRDPWDKLENALHGIVDKDKFEHFRSTESLPFDPGEHRTIGVKVFDNRGNEVVRITKLRPPEKA